MGWRNRTATHGCKAIVQAAALPYPHYFAVADDLNLYRGGRYGLRLPAPPPLRLSAVSWAPAGRLPRSFFSASCWRPPFPEPREVPRLLLLLMAAEATGLSGTGKGYPWVGGSAGCGSGNFKGDPAVTVAFVGHGLLTKLCLRRTI